MWFRWALLAPLGILWLWYALNLHPTITEIVKAHRDNDAVVVAVGAVIGGLTTWAWNHLLVEQ